MASAVAAPLERQFAHIAGLSEMTSASYLGSTIDYAPVRSESQHRRRGARCAGGDQRARAQIFHRTSRKTRPIGKLIRPTRRL